MNTYCKLFLDTDNSKQEVIALLLSITHGNFSGRSTIYTDILNMYVEDNDEFDTSARCNSTDGFLYYRYYCDIEPFSQASDEDYISAIATLIRTIVAQGYRAVPACDFEDQLV